MMEGAYINIEEGRLSNKVLKDLKLIQEKHNITFDRVGYVMEDLNVYEELIEEDFQ